MLLASGRDVDVGRKNDEGKTAAERARERNETACAEMVEAYIKNPNFFIVSVLLSSCGRTVPADFGNDPSKVTELYV